MRVFDVCAILMVAIGSDCKGNNKALPLHRSVF